MVIYKYDNRRIVTHQFWSEWLRVKAPLVTLRHSVDQAKEMWTMFRPVRFALTIILVRVDLLYFINVECDLTERMIKTSRAD